MSGRMERAGAKLFTPMKKPNIVFVLTDDQGYGDLACHGNPWLRTPHLDALSAQCVNFADYHTGPTCAPTRAGLFTGRHHNSTGVWHTIGGRSLLRKDEISLATVLSKAGYATGLFGKWHLGDNYPYRPFDRGFGECVVHGGGGIGQTNDYWGNDYFDDTYFDMGVPRKFEGYCTDVFFGLATDFITRHKSEPFFCMVATNAPHVPLRVDEKHAKPYEGAVDSETAKFYGMIANIDDNVGGMRSFLAGEGLADNTIFIFMTDNGTCSGCKVDAAGFVTSGHNAGMRGLKGMPYEGGHRTPFMLCSPAHGLDTKNNIETLCANIDVMPTLLDLCGVDAPECHFDGESLAPLMMGRANDLDERIIVTDSQRVPNPIKYKDYCVMHKKWRLVKGELYNLMADPGQRHDVRDAHPEMRQKLATGYEVWWDKVSVRFDEEIPISIGSDHEKATRISSHDWRGDVGDCAWNQGEIRGGKICNSHAEIFAEQDGDYTFELRRWPGEQGGNITGGLGAWSGDWFAGGVALDIRKAVLSVGGQTMEAGVTAQDPSITFTLRLARGSHKLQSYFYDSTGNVRGAYYVYVTRAPEGQEQQP